ncbi:YlqD family protein [Lederbergia wuyishanensis]|nr:YlqD family protein [Lederbergia wuyishanensis]MCJ8006241.1 YlqD family protein [Lederbergia wuyishanensis]
MRILQTVSVKQVLTEMSKYKLQKRFKDNKQQLKKECDQLLFELKKLERTRKFTPSGLKTQFDKEIEMRKEKIKLIDFQIEQLDMLSIGSELHDQDIQAIIDIKVGDNWDEVAKGKTIVIKDGIIVEIRER